MVVFMIVMVELLLFGIGGGFKIVVFSLVYYNFGYLDLGMLGVVVNSVIMILQCSYNGGVWQIFMLMQVGGQMFVYYDELWEWYSYEVFVGGSVIFIDGLFGIGMFVYWVLFSGVVGLWLIILVEVNGSNFYIGFQELFLISMEG